MSSKPGDLEQSLLMVHFLRSSGIGSRISYCSILRKNRHFKMGRLLKRIEKIHNVVRRAWDFPEDLLKH